MVELQMVRRMVTKGLYLAPALIVALWIAGDGDYALSGGVGLAMTLGNLWLAARLIGVVAEKHPTMLVPAAMLAFTVGLALVTLISYLLKTASVIVFPVTGFTLIGSHLLLVAWEAVSSYRVQPETSVQVRET